MQLSNPQLKKYAVFKVDEYKKKLYLNQTYTITIEHPYFDVIEFYVNLLNKKNLQIQPFDQSIGINLYSFLELSLYRQQVQNKIQKKIDQFQCKICLESFGSKDISMQVEEDAENDLYILPCCHILHKKCIQDHMPHSSFLKCPICQKMVGFIFGNMPDGIMSHRIEEELQCPGYNKGTIIVQYEMFGGEKDGQTYDNANFRAYIPLGGKGHQVLFLLQQAFRRKLTFTVSKNKKKVNQIQWGKILHKTEIHGGVRGGGFPDQKFFDKVLNDLMMHGLQMT